MASKHKPPCAMYAVDLSDAVEATIADPIENAPIADKPALALIWENPEGPVERNDNPVLILECRHRRHANAILNLLEQGYIREVRRGDRLVFQVYQGTEPVRMSVVPGIRSAA